MAKEKIKDIVENLLQEYLDESDLQIWNIEFVKEVKDWFLRIYIDKKEIDSGEAISLEDCEKLSKYLSEKLDENDLIEQNYYLEVSSPGIDRELITDNHCKTYIGSLVDIKLYKALDGKKEITVKLKDIDNKKYYVIDEYEKEIEIDKSGVAKIKLAVIF